MHGRTSPRFSRLLPTALALLAISLVCSPAPADIPAGTLRPNDLIVNRESDPGGYEGIDIVDGTNGQLKGNFVLPQAGGLSTWALDMTIGPDGNLYVSDYRNSQVLRYNGTTGVFIDQFVKPGSGGLGAPVGVAFLPDGNLYVSANGGSNGTSVLRYHGRTGEYLGVAVPHQFFTSTPDPWSEEYYDPWFEGYYDTYPEDLLFGADGRLYISVYPVGTILRYNPNDPNPATATETFAADASGSGAFDQMTFGPDGILYVHDSFGGRIRRFEGKTGAELGDLTSGGTSVGLCTGGITFGPDGKLYIASSLTGTDGILRLEPATGDLINQFSMVGGFNLIFNAGVTPASTTNPITGQAEPVSISPIPTATLTFDNIVSPGQTTITPLNADSIKPDASLPANLQLATASGGFPTYFDIHTTANFNGQPVLISFAYDPDAFFTSTNPSAPALLHLENSAWVDVTRKLVEQYPVRALEVDKDGVLDGVDTINKRVYGITTSFSPFAIASRKFYDWSGYLQPINTTGTMSVFKKGGTVPVKFTLKGTDTGITKLVAHLSCRLLTNNVPGEVNEATSTSAATSGTLFRYDAASGQYIFNLSTKSLSTGQYQLKVHMGDGKDDRTVTIAVK